MKTLCLLVALALPIVCSGAECVGADPCKACRDCSRCRYCSPQNAKGGSCGTLRSQNAQEVRKRLQKQGR